MADPEIQLQPGERICYRTHPNRKWYVIAWKVLIGAAGVFFFSILIMGLLAQSVVDLLSRFLPEATSFLITQILCLGLVPLLILAWVVEDIVQTFRGAFVLTDRRIWVRCSPYTWNRSEIPLDDISSMTASRGAVFIRVKSSRKIHVHMFSDSGEFVKAYEKLTGKGPPPR